MLGKSFVQTWLGFSGVEHILQVRSFNQFLYNCNVLLIRDSGGRMMSVPHSHILYGIYFALPVIFTPTAQGGPYAYNPHSDSQHLAEENEELTSQLRDKVRELKSVSRTET